MLNKNKMGRPKKEPTKVLSYRVKKRLAKVADLKIKELIKTLPESEGLGALAE